MSSLSKYELYLSPVWNLYKNKRVVPNEHLEHSFFFVKLNHSSGSIEPLEWFNFIRESLCNEWFNFAPSGSIGDFSDKSSNSGVNSAGNSPKSAGE